MSTIAVIHFECSSVEFEFLFLTPILTTIRDSFLSYPFKIRTQTQEFVFDMIAKEMRAIGTGTDVERTDFVV